MMSSSSGVIPVRVAVRFRPLSSKEVYEGCEGSVSVIEGRQVVLDPGSRGSAFTYDFAFAEDSSQEDIYVASTADLIPELFKGYNVTVLAYGQTGSGKTHTMGTTNSLETSKELLGIIPRAITDIFSFLARKTESSFSTRVSFVELYKETLFDLLSSKSAKKEDCTLDIREDPRIGLHIANLAEVSVNSLEDTLNALEMGSRKRVTAATAMNNVSSRSHAIFTFHINWTNAEKEVLAAKFHLVDLAGSERQKKTKATGDRLKEGIDINRGLLALGNVIAALGEGGSPHIPYRDSKLTRLLQDSLGGNSHTLMIACSSPADSNLDETLSTLRYADRARKIKNKPIVNREGKEMEIKKLKSEIASLRAQLSGQGNAGQNPTNSEEAQKELQEAAEKLKAENRELTSALMTVQGEIMHLNEGIMMTESVNQKLKSKLTELSQEFKTKVHGEDSIAYENVVSKVEEVLETYKDSENKMVEFEMSRGNVSGLEESTTVGDEEGTTAHALRQNHLANELQNLNKLLAQKEQLANAMNMNEEKFKEMKAKYDTSISAMEAEIQQMNSEMEELLRLSRKDSSKVSEVRQKRIQELEGLIQDLRRKMSEQQKAIKLNEKDKAKMNKLSEEIMTMKQTKVKLVRQMKEDAEKNRAWKHQKERELCKVKQSERKNLVKITRMENLHNKEKSVWKRKIEEVAAVNAKLKTIVDKQKAAKAMKGSSGLSGSGDRVRSFIQDELEVMAGHKEALVARENFIKERTSLKSKLNHCQQELRTTLNSHERTEIDQKITHLLNEIDDRSSGISNLQKTISDLDRVKEVSGGKWELLQTMTEAKIALEYLMEQCSSAQANLALLRSEHDNTNKANEVLSQNLALLQNQMDKLSSIHEDEVVQMSREHEEKVLFLLRQFHGKEARSCDDVEERIRIQESEIDKMSHLNEVLIQMKEENSRLKSELDDKKFPLPKAVKAPPVTPRILEEETDVEEEVSIDEQDDYSKDPDWKKTPLYHRIRNLKERSLNSSSNKQKLDMLSESEEEMEEHAEIPPAPKATRKRPSASLGCRCKGRCTDGRCSCRKKGKSCEDCYCVEVSCANRNPADGHTLSILNSDESLNGSKYLDDELLKVDDQPPDYRKETRKRVSQFNPPILP